MAASGETPANGDSLDRTRLTVAAGPLLAPVLARVVGVHAARADLPVDRVEDALLIADAIAAQGPAFAEGGRVSVAVRSQRHRLEIRVGPLREGGGQRLLDGAALPQAGRLLERLADDVRVRPGSAGGETLVLRVLAA